MVPDSGLGNMQTQIKVTAPTEKCSCKDYFSIKFNVQHTGKYSIKYELFFHSPCILKYITAPITHRK